MRKNLMLSVFPALVLLALSLLPSSLAYDATTYSGEYDIIEDKVYVTALVKLDGLSSDFEWRVPRDAEQVTANFAFIITSYPEYSIIRANSPILEAEMSYISKSFLEESESNFFILDLARIKADERTVLVKLPEDAKLKYSLTSDKASILPKTEDVLTDGRRIIIRWTEDDFDRSDAVLVMYEEDKNSVWLYALILAIVIFVVAAIFLIAKKRYLKNQDVIVKSVLSEKQKNLEQKKGKIIEHAEFTRNLFEEEKTIVETLLADKDHEMWQKQLELKTGINKVRLSRKLRSLEAKGLIEKIPYGNTNKIRLKK